jgi:hypothetical protein
MVQYRECCYGVTDGLFIFPELLTDCTECFELTYMPALLA